MYKSDSNAIFYRLAERPYTIAKVVFLDSNDKAIDFKARKLQYYIGQVPGFNIFFVHAGFHASPDHIVTDKEIKTHIDEMCKWYLHDKLIGNKRYTKLYKTKTNE